MEKLLKYTYLMDIKNIAKELSNLWERYQYILNHPNWEDLNEARAILYSVSYLYIEIVAPEAIERRLHLLKEPTSLLDFLALVDSKDKRLTSKRKDKLFLTLEQYYLIIKKFKNKYVGGKNYLDEDKFIKLYNKFNPDKKLRIREKGKY